MSTHESRKNLRHRKLVMAEPEEVDSIIFRELTDSDYFYINQPRDVQTQGGRQSYIDISTSAVGVEDWKDFFEDIETEYASQNRPYWKPEINSLGADAEPQIVKIGERRETNVSIRSQKLASRESNRVLAWHPEHTEFPKPETPGDRDSVSVYNLAIYIAKLEDGSYWAGWVHRGKPGKDWPINDKLDRIFEEEEGIIEGTGEILFNKDDEEWPFRIKETEGEETSQEAREEVEQEWFEEKEEKEITEELFEQDEAITSDTTQTKKAEIREVRRRNQKIVGVLKDLYGGKCQVTGTEFTFQKENGTYYSEAHHLVPLGDGGADAPHNLVILSPLIHKMLHYADVDPIDLSEIEDNELDITINGNEYTITWHSDHAELVEEAVKDSN